jgi:hypothetical protein
MDNSFTYIISNTDRTNDLPAAGLGIVYDVNFGGFSEQYDDYMCEVVSFAITAGITTANTYWMFCVENLCENGYFCKNKLTPKECVLSVLPLNAVQDAYIQSDGGNIRFRVNNCRMTKQVTFFFLKPDFTNVLCGTEINIPIAGDPPVPVETKWLLTLKMTPIEKR